MNFEQLEYFCAIAEYPTFFDAAEAMNTTQPTLSKQIMKLEQELDLCLLNRSHRKATLTDAGMVFYKDAKKLLEGQQALMHKLRSYRTSSRLHVGTLPFLTHYHFMPKIKSFEIAHPEITLILDEVEDASLLEGLRNQQYDFILTREHLVQQSGFDFYPITKDELVVVLPLNHPLASDEQIAWSSLMKEPFLLMNPYTSIYHKCKELFAQSNISPKILRTGRVESILSAVAMGEGISLLPKGNFEVFSKHGLALCSLSPKVPLPVGIALPARHKLTAVEKQFLHALK